MMNENELATRMRLVIGRLARRLRAESQADLTPSQVSALASIERCGEVTVGELAEVEHVRPPSMTRIVAALEEAKLVRREPDPADRRIGRIRLSESGRRAVGEIHAARSAFLAARLGELTERERAAIEKALPAFERLIEGWGGR